MKIHNLIIAASAFAALISAPAHAKSDPVQLEGNVMLEKTVTNDAGESEVTLVKPELITPGDRLIFTTDYKNTGSDTVTDFVVTNPVPSAVKVAADTSSDLIVSVDGGTTWDKLASLSVAGADGKSRPAVHADITHIRWTLASVDAGATGQLKYSAIIR